MCFLLRITDAISFEAAITASSSILAKAFPNNVATVLVSILYTFPIFLLVQLKCLLDLSSQSWGPFFQTCFFFYSLCLLPFTPVSVMPSVRVPKTERIRHPQQCKSIKGFIASASPGSCHIRHSGVEQEPRAQMYSSIYKFRTKTGSWQGLIGCRGFLVFTDWPVIIPLIRQLSSL